MNPYDIAASAVPMLLGLLYLAGLYAVFSDCIPYARARIRQRKRLKGPAVRKETLPSWAQAPARLASASLGKEVSARAALAVLASMFLLALVVSSRSFEPAASVIYSALFCALPLVILRLRLEDIQSRGSREGIALVTELSRQYRMQNRNIYRALENAVSSDGEFPLCRRQIYMLLLRLRAASGSREIRLACEDFSYALGTVWGSMLSACIRISAEKGSDVSMGLSDIADQLKAANKRAEERKRLNSEASRMTMFLVPVLYIGTMALARGYLGISLAELARNQFTTAEGLMMFLIIVILFMFNGTLQRLISRTRLDL